MSFWKFKNYGIMLYQAINANVNLNNVNIMKNLTCNQLLEKFGEIKIDAMTPELNKVYLNLKGVKRYHARGGLIEITNTEEILELINSGGRYVSSEVSVSHYENTYIIGGMKS